MRKRFWMVFTCILGLLLLLGGCLDNPEKILNRTAIVKVKLSGGKKRPNCRGFKERSSGLFITAAHCVGAAPLYLENSLGTISEAKVVYADRSSDVAILKSALPSRSLKVTERVLSKSEWIYGVCSRRFTLGYNMCKGLIRATIRLDPRFSTRPKYEIMVAGDIEPGDSGGAYIDSHGAVVGILCTGHIWGPFKGFLGTLTLGEDINLAIKKYLEKRCDSPKCSKFKNKWGVMYE